MLRLYGEPGVGKGSRRSPSKSWSNSVKVRQAGRREHRGRGGRELPDSRNERSECLPTPGLSGMRRADENLELWYALGRLYSKARGGGRRGSASPRRSSPGRSSEFPGSGLSRPPSRPSSASLRGSERSRRRESRCERVNRPSGRLFPNEVSTRGARRGAGFRLIATRSLYCFAASTGICWGRGRGGARGSSRNRSGSRRRTDSRPGR